jgi:hypoxanthine phosphoribosyltransferase
MPINNKIFLTADHFQEDCFQLARKIYDDTTWRPELILALWRGGAQPGVIISEVFSFLGLNIPHNIIKCSSYESIGEQSNIRFFGADDILKEIQPGQRVLIVDDVFDTGRTAAAVRQRLTHADTRFAMVYWKPEASKVDFAPDYYIHKCNQWIVFPHELKDLTRDEIRQKSPQLEALLFSNN